MTDTPEAQRVKAVQQAVRGTREARVAATPPAPLVPEFRTQDDGTVVDRKGNVVFTPPALPPLGKEKGKT